MGQTSRAELSDILDDIAREYSDSPDETKEKIERSNSRSFSDEESDLDWDDDLDELEFDQGDGSNEPLITSGDTEDSSQDQDLWSTSGNDSVW